MTDDLIEARGICKYFKHPSKVTVLKDLDFSVRPGESVAIMGASGEGKSTLLNILGTLEAPNSGSLKILGQPVTASQRARVRNQHIGFIFQSFHLLEDYTAIDNVLMPAAIARTATRPGSAMYKRAEELLQAVGLSDRAQFSSKLLSGGEKQRVAIARALCNDPQLILADEPSGNLDHQSSKMIHDLLFKFLEDSGKSLVVVTHDQELANLCDRCLILQDGLLHPST